MDGRTDRRRKVENRAVFCWTRNRNNNFRYVVAMCLMIAGFAFAFMVVSFGLEGDVFKHPLKSGMTTLTMVLGEFNFGELYQAFGREL